MKAGRKLPGKKVIAVVLLVVVVIVTVLLLVGSHVWKQDGADKETIVITTPYCDLLYPGKWNNSLRTESQEGELYVVSFYGSVSKTEEHALFDVVFGGDSGYHVGYVAGKNGKPVAVSVNFHDIEHNRDWTEEQSNTIYAMQDDAGYLIDRIPLIQWEETEESLSTKIQTAYGVLHYPGKWADRINVEISENSAYIVSFRGCFADNIWCPMFDIVFDDADNVLGYIPTETDGLVSVGVRVYDLQENVDWTPEMEQEFYEMQEGLNDVLADLKMESAGESVNTVRVETPYVVLQYSADWGTALYTQITEEEIYKVSFYGQVGDIEPKHLFDLCFGGDNGTLLGWVTDARVPVYLTCFDLDPKWNWPHEDLDSLYAMQEEVNVIISYLNQEETFEPSV